MEGGDRIGPRVARKGESTEDRANDGSFERRAIGDNSECASRNMVGWLVRSASLEPFLLSGRRLRSEGQRGGWRWPPQQSSLVPLSSRQRGGDAMAGATLVAPPTRHAPTGRPGARATYSCSECEHVLRVSGLGRHRVYFELDGDQSDDPVMNGACPACGHGLPGKNGACSRS